MTVLLGPTIHGLARCSMKSYDGLQCMKNVYIIKTTFSPKTHVISYTSAMFFSLLNLFNFFGLVGNSATACISLLLSIK